jgi:hypothetical protein
MARVARPGGRVAVIDLEGNEDPCLDDLNHELEVLHDSSHVRSYTAALWRALFETSGLAIEAVEPGHTELPGGLAVSRWCEIGDTPQEARKEIQTRLARLSKEQLVGLGIRPGEGEFYIPVRTLVIVGRKG